MASCITPDIADNAAETSVSGNEANSAGKNPVKSCKKSVNAATIKSPLANVENIFIPLENLVGFLFQKPNAKIPTQKTKSPLGKRNS